MALSEEERAARVRAAVAAHDSHVEGPIRLPWRDETASMPVVQLDLEVVLLNPRSHRIRAQLESHPSSDVVRRDPWSPEAQLVIAEILRDLGENFDELKTNLDDEGQQQPGVITTDGMLVNANRRAVALRDLGKTHIRVAVLPDDATDPEIDQLELRLQMQEDFRERYTFTNRLLFVDELISRHNRTVNDVARALNLAASSKPKELAKGRAKVEQDTRVLQMVRTIQDRGDGTIPLLSFDSQEIALEELDARVQDMQAEDPLGAAQLYEIRLLGLLSNVPYRDLRRLDETVVEEWVMPIMREDDVLNDLIQHLPAAAAPRPDAAGGELEGLELLDDESGDDDETVAEVDRQIRALNDLLATTYGQDVLLVAGADGPRRLDRGPLIGKVYDSLRAAAEEIKQSNRDENRLVAPMTRLAEAEAKVRAAGAAYLGVADRDDFDASEFRDALDSVLRRLAVVADDAGHTLDC